jgi:hypothetical protein
MTINELKEIATVAQTFAVAAAALAAGLWAVVKTIALKEVPRAKAELARLTSSNERPPNVRVDVAVSLRGPTPELPLHLCVLVSYQNVGTAREYIDLEHSWVKAAKVIGIDQNKPVFARHDDYYRFFGIQGPVLFSTLSPNERHELPVLIPVEPEGLYFILVCLRGSKLQRAKDRQAHSDENGAELTYDASWAAATMFYVPAAERTPSGA